MKKRIDFDNEIKSACLLSFSFKKICTFYSNLVFFKEIYKKNEFRWGPAQKKFEMIVAKGGSSKMNAYAHIALGNVWLEQLFNPARKREDVSQFIQMLKRFQGKFLEQNRKKQSDPSNRTD